jgi:hypothetical protein
LKIKEITTPLEKRMPYSSYYKTYAHRNKPFIAGASGPKSVKSKLYSAIRTHRIKPFLKYFAEFIAEHGRLDEGVTTADITENLEMYKARHPWANPNDPISHIVNYRKKMQTSLMLEFLNNNTCHFVTDKELLKMIVVNSYGEGVTLPAKYVRSEADLVTMFKTLVEAGAVWRGKNSLGSDWIPAVLADSHDGHSGDFYFGGYRIYSTEIVHHFIDNHDGVESRSWQTIFHALTESRVEPDSINFKLQKYIVKQLFSHPKIAGDTEIQAILLKNFV